MSKQVVVRTYPYGCTNATTLLQNYLRDGYRVVSVSKITSEKSVEYLEYILEKNEEQDND